MNTEENRLYLCANTGAKCENPTMIKGIDLCYCDRRYLKSVKVENLAEEKLQQAAIKHSERSGFLSNFPHDFNSELSGFIAGAKSPESLEYWKEKEKLYNELDIMNYMYDYAEYIGQCLLDSKTESQILPVKQWFEKNKKK